VLFDDNGISIDGPTVARRLGRPGEALQGRRLGAERVDGHDPEGDRRRDRRGAKIPTSRR
jgi:hypothetical protein